MPDNREGDVYTGEVLTPASYAVMKTSYMTASGVGPSTLLELTGVYDGRPFTLAFEFSPRDALSLAADLTQASVGR